MGCGSSASREATADSRPTATFDAAAEPKQSALKKARDAKSDSKRVSFFDSGSFKPIAPGEGESNSSSFRQDDPNKVDNTLPTFVPLGHVPSEDSSAAGDSPPLRSPPDEKEGARNEDPPRSRSLTPTEQLHASGRVSSPVMPIEEEEGRISPKPEHHEHPHNSPDATPRNRKTSGDAATREEDLPNPLKLRSTETTPNASTSEHPFANQSSDDAHLSVNDGGEEHSSPGGHGRSKRVSFSAAEEDEISQ